MDWEKIAQIIERKRPLTANSSLPFVVIEGDAKQIRWFNYYVSQADELTACLFIRTVFVVDELFELSKYDVNIQLELKIQDEVEPTIDEDEYYRCLGKIDYTYSNKTEIQQEMISLLEQAEIKSLLCAYQTVLSFTPF